MLLEFRMKNFKSFKEEMIFTMIPRQIKDLKYSIITKKAKDKYVRALCSAVIYGPNSAGKTNIIGGMEVLRSIILRGNIVDDEAIKTPNIAVNRLTLIPNIENSENEPVSFYIKFIEQDLLIEFSLSIKLGVFFNGEYKRKIINEELRINENVIYARDNELKIGKIDSIRKYLMEDISKSTLEKIAKANLDDKELFLNGPFKTLYSKKIYDIIINWIREKFEIIYRADVLQVAPVIDLKEEEKKYVVDMVLNKAVKQFGLTSEEVIFGTNEDKSATAPLSVIDVKAKKSKALVPTEIFESLGTVRFLNMFPIILNAIRYGRTLVVDELDASIHPMAIMNIINIFHNDEINKNGAQLIFNTHNPIFLNSSLLRRDEIKFVERDKNGSTHYSLSDFGTSGENGVRNNEDYMKNYFINKYGAIENIDFSDIIKETIGEEDR